MNHRNHSHHVLLRVISNQSPGRQAERNIRSVSIGHSFSPAVGEVEDAEERRALLKRADETVPCDVHDCSVEEVPIKRKLLIPRWSQLLICYQHQEDYHQRQQVQLQDLHDLIQVVFDLQAHYLRGGGRYWIRMNKRRSILLLLITNDCQKNIQVKNFIAVCLLSELSTPPRYLS